MKSQRPIGKTHLFKLETHREIKKYLDTHLKTLTYKIEQQSASYNKAKVQLYTKLVSNGLFWSGTASQTINNLKNYTKLTRHF